MLNHALDLFTTISMAGVLFAVGDDKEDNLGGPLFFWKGGELLAHGVNGGTHGIQEGGIAFGTVGGIVDAFYAGNLNEVVHQCTSVVEGAESEEGFTRESLLLLEEGVEGAHGVMAQAGHGAGAVDNYINGS